MRFMVVHFKLYLACQDCDCLYYLPFDCKVPSYFCATVQYPDPSNVRERMKRRSSMVVRSLILLEISMLVGKALLSLQSDKRGPYDVVWKSFEDCGGEHALIKYDTRWGKATRTTVRIEGTFTNNISLNNDLKCRAVMQQLTPNGWKDNYMNFDFGDVGACDVITTFFDRDDILRLGTGMFDENGTAVGESICNVRPGVYTIQPFDFSFQAFKGFPVFFYGTYRARSTIFYKNFDGYEIGCCLIYFDVVPKKKNG